MNLSFFAKDKELVLKITNAILLIWIIAAICFSISNLVNIVFKDPVYSFEEYSNAYCYEDEVKQDCKSRYQNELFNNDNSDIYNKRSLIISISNVIVVSGFVILLNKEKSNKKRK